MKPTNTLKSRVVLTLLISMQVGRASDALDNWTSHYQFPRTANSTAIAYGNGQFVVVGYPYPAGPAPILTSTDGVNWTPRRSGITNSLFAIAYGNGQFVAVGNSVLTSADGVDWIERQPVNYLYAIGYGNGLFVASGYRRSIGDYVTMSSTDGANWIQRETGLEHAFSAVAFGNSQFVAVSGSGGTQINTSTDGVTWVQRQSGINSPPYRSGIYGIAFGKGLFVAVGNVGVDLGPPINANILTSTDGVNWVQRLSWATNGLSSVAYGNGQFVAVSPGGILLTSSDGANWIPRPSGPNDWISAIAYGNGHFVTVGGSIFESSGIINLSIAPNAGTGLLALSLEGPSGLDYTIQSSTDLTSWRDVTKITGAPSGKVTLDSLPATAGGVFYRASSQ